MANDDRNSILSRQSMPHCWYRIVALSVLAAVSACGLIYDGFKYVLPEKTSQDVLCERDHWFVGLAAGPYPPFIFPIAHTDRGPRVTGFDIELVKSIQEQLSHRCGKSIRMELRLVPFLDLFTLLHEDKLDLFISATPANVPGTGRGGFAYSLPYFEGSGLAVAARTREIADQIQAAVALQRDQKRGEPTVRHRALSRFRTAVVDGSSGAAYAEANFTSEQFIVCNTLTAAFHASEQLHDQPDIILGSAPVLAFTTQHEHPRWQLVQIDDHPWLLTHENFSIVTGDARLHVLWFLNDLLFELDQRGELQRMKQRWLVESYDPMTRADEEGLPVPDEARDAQARNHCYVGKPGFGRLRDLGRG
jgi:ABC-type amino acid transport substrate-binding protein